MSLAACAFSRFSMASLAALASSHASKVNMTSGAKLTVFLLARLNIRLTVS